MKKIKEIAKKIMITFCIIYFVASIIGNIAFYIVLYGQFEELSQDKSELIEQYKDAEKNLEEQLKDYKQEKGENYPVMVLLQYTQYMLGAEMIITVQLKLAVYSIGFSIVIVCVKETIKYIKIRKDVKKNG